MIDWVDSSFPIAQVAIELISCKCGGVCKRPECRCFLITLRCSPACLINMIDDHFDEHGDDTAYEDESDCGDDDA